MYREVHLPGRHTWHIPPGRHTWHIPPGYTGLYCTQGIPGYTAPRVYQEVLHPGYTRRYCTQGYTRVYILHLGYTRVYILLSASYKPWEKPLREEALRLLREEGKPLREEALRLLRKKERNLCAKRGSPP